MSEQHFAIQLEDYSLPAILPFPKTYYGTLPQIGALMDCLAADPDTAIRFASTIRACRNNAEHIQPSVPQQTR